MTLDSLEKLGDDELQALIARSGDLLKERDRQRKDKAMEEARAILVQAGLTPLDLAGKKKSGKHGGGQDSVYRGGHRYQHPTRKELVWKAKGQKPNWLRELESEGGRAVELG